MSKCILCFEEHDRKWINDEPAMYCHKCADIKKDSIDVVSEIYPTLFLSGIQAAKKYQGHRLYVHEDPAKFEGHSIHLPILIKRPNSKIDRNGAVASFEALDKASAVINDHMIRGEPLLVHCVGGVERSPLTIAWFLLKTRRFNTMLEAYAFLKAKRPVVSERLFWLPQT